MAIIYEKTLTMTKLRGRRDCEIRYVESDGSFYDLSFEAHKRNIVLTSISFEKFCENTRKIVKVGEVNGAIG